MKRRVFLGTAGLAGILAAGVAPAVQAGQAIRWRLASSFPRTLGIPFGAAEVFSHTLKEMSGGKFDISIHAADELMHGLEVLEGIQRGTVECGHTAGYYYSDKDETFAFDTAIPFGLNARQMNAWLLEDSGPGFEPMHEFHRSQGIVAFPMGNTGTQMGGWYRRPIRSVADLKGLKIRIPGLGGRVFKRLGALPSALPASEIYRGLKQGRIDAAEWSGPYGDLQLGLQKTVRYYAYPGWWEGGAQLSLYVNRRAYEALSDENKAMLSAAAAVAHRELQAQHDLKNPPALKALIAEGTQLVAFPPAVLKAARKAAEDLFAEIGERNPQWRKIYPGYAAFRDEQAVYAGYTELAFDSFMHQQVLQHSRTKPLPARGKSRG